MRVAVLGSTGSIGRSTLDVIAASPGRFVPHLLAARRSVEPLLEQARRFRPAWVVIVDPDAAATVDATSLPPGTRLAVGDEALDELVADPAIDRVVAAIVGGTIGAQLGAFRLPVRVLRLLIAAVLAVASVKLLAI